MNWVIERDNEGKPRRLHWLRIAPDKPQQAVTEAKRHFKVNSLPMPAMRRWAQDRGLI